MNLRLIYKESNNSKVRFDYTIKEINMSNESLKDTWKKTVCSTSNSESWEKKNFKICLTESDIIVYHCESRIYKPFFNLDQAMYWCEGRMFDSDPTYIDFSTVDKKDVNKFKKIGSLTFFDTETHEEIGETIFYQGRDGSGLENVYAKEKTL